MWVKMPERPKICERYEKLADNFRKLAEYTAKDGLEKMEKLAAVAKAKQLMSPPRTVFRTSEGTEK